MFGPQDKPIERRNANIYQNWTADKIALDVIAKAIASELGEGKTMLPFNSWGDPYSEDYSWRQLEIGKPVKVKPSVPVTGGRVGTLKSKGDTWIVEFSDGSTMGYDPDMLMKP